MKPRKQWRINTNHGTDSEKNRTEENWRLYVNKINLATKKTRKAKSDFENKIANEVKVNAKSFWKYVTKQKSRSGIPDLQMEDGSWVRDDQEKAEALNGFFGSIFY